MIRKLANDEVASFLAMTFDEIALFLAMTVCDDVMILQSPARCRVVFRHIKFGLVNRRARVGCILRGSGFWVEGAGERKEEGSKKQEMNSNLKNRLPMD